MAGLRNILLTCFRANIKQVSIPLLLTRGTELSPTIRRTNSKNNLLSKTALSAVFSGISVEDTATGTDVSDKTILPLIYKRSEAVLKSVKGFLLECSRSYGRRGGAQALSSAADDTSFGMENTSTVQFVIPPHATAETVFHTLKDMIKEIFRAA